MIEQQDPPSKYSKGAEERAKRELRDTQERSKRDLRKLNKLSSWRSQKVKLKELYVTGRLKIIYPCT